jgi:hypothetical protein
MQWRAGTAILGAGPTVRANWSCGTPADLRPEAYWIDVCLDLLEETRMYRPTARTMWYDKLPTLRDKQTQEGYSAWLRSLPFQIYLTTTFAYSVSAANGGAQFNEFINRLERHYRAPIGYIRGDEVSTWSGLGLAAARLHYHALLCSTAKLDPARIEQEWHALGHFANNAKAELYDPTRDAIGYCMKFLHEPGNKWDMRNLDLFSGFGSKPANFRKRRRLLRQQARMV